MLAMWWRRRKARKAAEKATDASWDSYGHQGQHRLVDGDVVPLPNGKRWVDYLKTEEHPMINRAPLVPQSWERSGERKWL